MQILGRVKLHGEVLDAWDVLAAAALAEGFHLTVASGFRSFERQLAIWNAKLLGEREVLDDQGSPLDLKSLSPIEAIKSVMRWSALPGASRHHWGTDVDIYDAAALPEDYALQLVPEEYQADGPFGPCMGWLRGYLAGDSSPDFFFPYAEDGGGVAPEPWHLSYRPLARHYQQQWDLSSLVDILADSDIQHKSVILDHMNELYQQFIKSTIFP